MRVFDDKEDIRKIVQAPVNQQYQKMAVKFYKGRIL
ncbi:hypothetical protein H0A61_00550 [Koleobacter methoxysyntrophicus]|jgi:hypothetical protein|uniref:Uncharacterized protein n=1 Tax=Koleobacter methoxysyntrophicus TaxID=2751313 RepID=A0A8A0RKS3_9FIRM|nr:hypothetical protein H0A61_00550 [Koleobacter methoxysyntrophicus]